MLDEGTVAHEASHAAAALLCGMTVTEVDARGDGRTEAGHIRTVVTDDWRALVKTLMAAGVPAGYPPNASRSNGSASAYDDVVHLRKILQEQSVDRNRFYELKFDAEALTATPEFRSLKAMFERALTGLGGRLTEDDVAAVHRKWLWDRSG